MSQSRARARRRIFSAYLPFKLFLVGEILHRHGLDPIAKMSIYPILDNMDGGRPTCETHEWK
jgi:hypothetical protein